MEDPMKKKNEDDTSSVPSPPPSFSPPDTNLAKITNSHHRKTSRNTTTTTSSFDTTLSNIPLYKKVVEGHLYEDLKKKGGTSLDPNRSLVSQNISMAFKDEVDELDHMILRWLSYMLELPITCTRRNSLKTQMQDGYLLLHLMNQVCGISTKTLCTFSIDLVYLVVVVVVVVVAL